MDIIMQCIFFFTHRIKNNIWYLKNELNSVENPNKMLIQTRKYINIVKNILDPSFSEAVKGYFFNEESSLIGYLAMMERDLESVEFKILLLFPCESDELENIKKYLALNRDNTPIWE